LRDTPRFRKFRYEFRAETEVDTDKSNSARNPLSQSFEFQKIEIAFKWLSLVEQITQHKPAYVPNKRHATNIQGYGGKEPRICASAVDGNERADSLTH
jgi:hypothetical protein